MRGRLAIATSIASVLVVAILVVTLGGFTFPGRSAEPGVGREPSEAPLSSTEVESPAEPASPPPTPAPGAWAAPDDPGVTSPKPRIDWTGPADWQIQHPSSAGSLTEAFADAPSYLPGETLRLAVHTTAARYTVAVFRLGPDMPKMSDSTPQRGVGQPGAILSDPASLEVRAPWTFDYSQDIPAAWPSGIYLAKVSGIGGADGYAVFTVRSTRPSEVLLVENVVNDQAYNAWGGTSFYVSSRGELAPGVHHASAVSLDRPFAGENGAGQLFEQVAPFAIWLERNGYDVAYTTDYDLATHPDDQPLPRTVLFSGHDEYWGVPLRDWLDLHVLERGDLDLGVFAANTGYWPVSFRDPSPTGPRTVVVYKEAITNPDLGSRPAYLPDGRPKTLQYRNLLWGDRGPANRPEQALLGVEYGYIATGASAYSLAPTAPDFLLAGTGLSSGASLGRIVAGEVDFVQPSFAMEPGDSVVAEGRGFRTRDGVPGLAQAVLRQRASGGRVFAAGTFRWIWGLDPGYAQANDVPAGFERLTTNIVDFLARR
jgi:hypothetical protein